MRDLTNYPTGLELTEHAATDDGVIGAVLTPVGDADHEAEFFADLDSGKQSKWPEELPADDGATVDAVEAAKNWAADHGADLMCVAQPRDDGTVQYVLVGIGLQLWQIDPLDAMNIKLRLKEGKLPEGRKLEHPELLTFDAKSGKNVAQTGCSFLYLTTEQSIGLIAITDFVIEVRNMGGAYGDLSGVGFHRGVRFDITPIAR